MSLLFSLLLVLTTAWLPAAADEGNELLIYSSRKEHLIRDIFQRYEKETGVRVRYRTASAGSLIQLLKSEGSNTRADLLLTVDAGNLWFAAREGLLYPVRSRLLESAVPPHLRDKKNRWFGLSVRARTIVYHRDRVSPRELSGYESLAEPKWRGRLCLRTSKKVYNQSLVAMLIHELGTAQTKKVVTGWVDNVAKIYFSDTLVLEALKAGKCDVGIVNSYYYGRMLKKDPSLPLKIFWPNQKSYGVHVNVSGIGLTYHGRKKSKALQLVEWLASPKVQKSFAQINWEYPILSNSPLPDLMEKWGKFRPNVTFPLTSAGELQQQAIRLMYEARYR